MSGSNWNLRNPAVKRIVQELKELRNDDSPDLVVEANEDNIFEFFFAIRGAWDSEFEGGIYHGRIIMPAEYPFKPPAFVMLTPSGRFETNTKICLSISSHHPESWQPSWSVRSALIALIAFMQSPGAGALGSLDQPKDVRRQLAVASREKPPTFGNEARQKVINEMHQRMLDMEARSRQQHVPPPPTTPAQEPQQEQAGEAAPAGEAAAAPEAGSAEAIAVAEAEPASAAGSPTAAAEAPAAPLAAAAPVAEAEGLRQRTAATAPAAVPAPATPAGPPAWAAQPPAPAPVPASSLEDRLLTWVAVLLVAGIVALLARRLLGGVLLGDSSMAGHGGFSEL